MSTHLSLKNRIKELRFERGLTQVQLAILSGVPQSVISDLENGKCSCSAYNSGLLCQALGCSWDDVFYFEV